jgi:hypothetical protein
VGLALVSWRDGGAGDVYARHDEVADAVHRVVILFDHLAALVSPVEPQLLDRVFWQVARRFSGGRWKRSHGREDAGLHRVDGVGEVQALPSL